MKNNNLQDKDSLTGHHAIIMPPPNVTGVLHLGHALNLFMQDALVRFYRLQGKQIIWIPGTDHAGIATQLIVESQIKKEDNPGSQNLLERIWQWKEKSESNIRTQLEKMNLALDWEYYTFSLDDKVATAVNAAFHQLYNIGLIFRDKRMVNWDIELQTVLSDIETEMREVNGHMYYIKYRCTDGREIEVATTRPETIFADTAIAVNPTDTRYTEFIGCEFMVPLTNRLIAMIADDRCSTDMGTGVVKIDPAHSFLDFEIGKTHNLPIRQIIDRPGIMYGDIPDNLQGIDRLKARHIVAEMLNNTGQLSSTEEIKHLVPHGIRSGSILEPILSDQWFLDMPKLKSDILEVLESGKIMLHPSRFGAIYRHYTEKLQPWCISRQIIWGHRIPAWYTESGDCYVAKTYEDACKIAGTSKLTQDHDVLDTWFSSALWPLVTAGWPESLADYFPNDFLVTGSDILFFWVFKMIVMSLALESKIPFRHVLLHGLVQDEYGLKMSKSKGNVVEPIALLETYGRDVLAFSLLSASVAGNNIRFGNQNIDMSRKFITKIRNGFEYCIKAISNIGNTTYSEIKHPVNVWIIKQLEQVENEVSESVKSWDLYHASGNIYHFFWNVFCSWYIESSKYLLKSSYNIETVIVIQELCLRFLQILYPFLPNLALEYWPKFNTGQELGDVLKQNLEVPAIESDFETIQSVIDLIRSVKSHFYLAEPKIILSSKINTVYIGIIEGMTKSKLRINDESHDGVCFRRMGIAIRFPDLTLDSAKPVLLKITSEIKLEIEHLQTKLNNTGFLLNATQDDIETKRNRLAYLEEEVQTYLDILELNKTT